MHASAVRSARELLSRAHVTQQKWVKAHQYQPLEKLPASERESRLAQMSPQQRRDVMGNHFADRLAVRARERGAWNVYDASLAAEREAVRRKTVAIARAIKSMLAL